MQEFIQELLGGGRGKRDDEAYTRFRKELENTHVRRTALGCGCECCFGGFCGGCGHAGCGGRNR